MSLLNTIHNAAVETSPAAAPPGWAAAEHGPGPGRSVRLRRRDRRPKAEEKRDKRSISLSPRLNALLEAEHRRMGFPSASALIEHAVTLHLSCGGAGDPAGRGAEEGAGAGAVLRQLSEIGRLLRALGREAAERDVAATEMLAGFVRAYFAMTPPPTPEEREARVAAAEARFERFLHAVGRRIESGDTTLRRLPEVKPLAASDPAAGAELA